MQQKENFLSTQRGRIIAGSSGLVGIVVIYLLLAWMIGFWPFGKLTKDKINAMVIDPGKVESSVSIETATTKVGELDKGYSALETAAKKLKKNENDDVKSAFSTLKTSIDQIKAKLNASPFVPNDFYTDYNSLKKDAFQQVANAIIKAADLK